MNNIAISRNDSRLAHALARGRLAEANACLYANIGSIASVNINDKRRAAKQLERSRKIHGDRVFLEDVERLHGSRARWAIGYIVPKPSGFEIGFTTYNRAVIVSACYGRIDQHAVARYFQRYAGEPDFAGVEFEAKRLGAVVVTAWTDFVTAANGVPVTIALPHGGGLWLGSVERTAPNLKTFVSADQLGLEQIALLDAATSENRIMVELA